MSLVGLSMDIMLPAFGEIAQDLKLIKPTYIQYIVIAFIFGMAVGELFFGSLADAFGRKKIILIGLAIYIFGSVIAIIFNSFEMLVLGRIIQGIGVAGPKIGTRALIRDLFEGAAMARLMSIIFGVLILVPMLAPLMGQFILQTSGWRYIFIGLCIMSIGLAIWLWQRQAESLGKDKRIPLAFKPLILNSVLILKHRHGMAYMLCAGLLFGGQLCYLALAYPIFVELYNVGGNFAFYFALIALGSGLGFFSNVSLVKYFDMQMVVNVALLFMLLINVIFLWVSSFYDGAPPLTLFIIYCWLVFLAIGIIFGNVNAIGMQYFGRVAGLASSIFASISSLVAVIISSFFGGFYNGTILPLNLIFTCVAIMSIILLHWAKQASPQPV